MFHLLVIISLLVTWKPSCLVLLLKPLHVPIDSTGGRAFVPLPLLRVILLFLLLLFHSKFFPDILQVIRTFGSDALEVPDHEVDLIANSLLGLDFDDEFLYSVIQLVPPIEVLPDFGIPLIATVATHG